MRDVLRKRVLRISPEKNSMEERLKTAEEVFGKKVDFYEAPARGDLRDPDFVYGCFESFRPEAALHLGEQPSAPYSMIDLNHQRLLDMGLEPHKVVQAFEGLLQDPLTCKDREPAKEDVIEPKARWNRIHQWYASGPATRASLGVKISATSKFAKIHRMRFWQQIQAIIRRDRSEPARP